MKKFFLALIPMFLFACGVPSGEDGKDGRDGSDGKPAVCAIIKKDDKNFLSCKNSDGSVVEAEIKDGADGQPGIDAVAYSLSCKHFWSNEGAPESGHDVAFNVIFLNDGSALAALHTQYKAPSSFEFVQTTTAYWAKASGNAEKALVENTLWKAEIVNKTSAKIFRKGVNQERTLQCSEG